MLEENKKVLKTALRQEGPGAGCAGEEEGRIIPVVKGVNPPNPVNFLCNFGSSPKTS